MKPKASMVTNVNLQNCGQIPNLPLGAVVAISVWLQKALVASLSQALFSIIFKSFLNVRADGENARTGKSKGLGKIKLTVGGSDPVG